jgi:hypothetical protein
MNADVNDNAPGSEGSRKYLIGSTNMYLKAFNPDMAGLKALGIKANEEPSYFLMDREDKTKVTGVRLAFFLENTIGGEAVKTVLNLYLRKSYIESEKDGVKRSQFIDQYGKTAFESQDAVDTNTVEASWVDGATLKRACSGQAELIAFVIAYAGIKNGSPCNIDGGQLAQVFSGNYAPIRSVMDLAMARENCVRLLLGVKVDKDKVYSFVYDRKFDFPYSNTSKYLHKDLFRNATRLPKGVKFPGIKEEFNEAEFTPRWMTYEELAEPEAVLPPTNHFGGAAGDSAVDPFAVQAAVDPFAMSSTPADPFAATPDRSGDDLPF